MEETVKTQDLLPELGEVSLGRLRPAAFSAYTRYSYSHPSTKSCGFHSQIINWFFVLHVPIVGCFLSPLNDVTRDLFTSITLWSGPAKCHELFGHRCNFQRCRWTWSCKWIKGLYSHALKGLANTIFINTCYSKNVFIALGSLVTLQNVVLNSPSHIVQARRLVSRFSTM